jgi:hypothetical protein
MEQARKIDIYHASLFTYFLERMRATPDGDGSLLDHSLLYWGSGMSNGNLHDRSNPPAILLGGAHGKLVGNRHVVAKEQEPTANLLVALAELYNVEIEQIGASSGKLAL